MRHSPLCFRLLQLLLLIWFVGVTPVFAAKESTLPEPYECYRSFEEITSRMVELTNLYPGLVRLNTIGQTFEGRPIQILQLGMEVETTSSPRLVIVSGLRANALTQAEINLSFAESLLDSYEKDANSRWLLEQTAIHLLIIANPDGRLVADQQAFAGITPTWTKNRHPSTCANGNWGVALNMNFSYGWSVIEPNPCSSHYPGPSAASEPETIAIQNYLDQILAENHNSSLVLDLQNNGDFLITPYLYSSTAENPYEHEFFMLANKLAYGTEAMPKYGSSLTIGITTGTLTDFAFGQLLAPSLQFNLGPDLAGGDITSCRYFEETLKPETLSILFRAAKLAADPLTQAQGPEIVFSPTEEDSFSVHVDGQADDVSFYRTWLSPEDFSPLHHAAFSMDIPPWSLDAVMVPVVGQALPESPYVMEFQNTFSLVGITPGRHMLYFQAWDTDPTGAAGNAGMINAIEINVPSFTFIPLLIR